MRANAAVRNIGNSTRSAKASTTRSASCSMSFENFKIRNNNAFFIEIIQIEDRCYVAKLRITKFCFNIDL